MDSSSSSSRKLHKGLAGIKGTKGGNTHSHTHDLFSIPWVFDHKMELLMEAVSNFPD